MNEPRPSSELRHPATETGFRVLQVRGTYTFPLDIPPSNPYSTQINATPQDSTGIDALFERKNFLAARLFKGMKIDLIRRKLREMKADQALWEESLAQVSPGPPYKTVGINLQA